MSRTQCSACISSVFLCPHVSIACSVACPTLRSHLWRLQLKMNIYRVIRVITCVIEAILHRYEYMWALRSWLALWCSLGIKSLNTTVLNKAVFWVYMYNFQFIFFCSQSRRRWPAGTRACRTVCVWATSPPYGTEPPSLSSGQMDLPSRTSSSQHANRHKHMFSFCPICCYCCWFSH